MKLTTNVTSTFRADGYFNKPFTAMKMRVRATLYPAIFLILGLSTAGSALAVDQISYTYDALGRLSSVTYPNGATVAYTYDPAGNRTQVTNTAGSGSTSNPQLPQQRRKMAALQAILSILLGN